MKMCEADGCDRPRRAQAAWSRARYCAMHADRVRLHGDPQHVRWASAWERFVDRVQVAANDCWMWLGSGTGRGGEYGQFWYGNQPGLAHRFSYETMVGPIPNGYEVDHVCRVKKCVNPAHLEVVTPQVNVQRAVAARKGATK